MISGQRRPRVAHRIGAGQEQRVMLGRRLPVPTPARCNANNGNRNACPPAATIRAAVAALPGSGRRTASRISAAEQGAHRRRCPRQQVARQHAADRRIAHAAAGLAGDMLAAVLGQQFGAQRQPLARDRRQRRDRRMAIGASAPPATRARPRRTRAPPRHRSPPADAASPDRRRGPRSRPRPAPAPAT